MSFKDNLRNELFYNSLEIKKFARQLHIPYSTMLSYLNQGCTPKADIAVRIAKALHVSVEYLITGNDSDFNLKFRDLYVTMHELENLPRNTREILQQLIHICTTHK